MATTTTPMKQQEDNLRGKAQEAADKAKLAAGNAYDKAKDTAGNIADRAREVASNVFDKTKETASNLGNTAEDATQAVGKGMGSLAATMRDNLPQSGVVGNAASTVASGLESGGRYLEQEGLSGMSDDLVNIIRRNPIPAILIGVGFGFLLARLTTTHRS